MPDLMQLTIFAGQVNTKFQASPGADQTVELELTGATDLGSTARHEQFSLSFRGPLDAYLPQRMYRLEHGVLGSLDLFLVPVGRATSGFSYEAVFNRLVELTETKETVL